MKAALDSFLGFMGVQQRPYWALARSLLLMDLRSQHYGRATGAKAAESIPPLYWVLGQYLFTSALICSALFSRVGIDGFILVNLTVSMLFAATAVIVEFNEVVLNIDDLEVVGPRPVSRRTYAFARLTNLAFYGVLVTIASNIFPVVIGSGFRDAGPWYAPTYLLVCAAGNAAVMMLVVVAYSFFPPRQGQSDYRDILAWVQIITALVAFYGAQLMLRDAAHSVELWLDSPPDWAQWTPPAWLSILVGRAAAGPTWQVAAWTAELIILTGLISLLGLLRLMRYYSAAQPASGAGDGGRISPRPMNPLLWKWLQWLGRSRDVAAVLKLSHRLMSRDGDLRMRTWPALATVIAVVAMGLVTHELGDPFGPDPNKSILSILAIQLLVIAVPTVIQNLRFSRDWAACWIFLTAPQKSPRVYSEALRLTACYGVALPSMLVLFVLFAIVWRNPLHALLHCVLGWMAVVAASHVVIRAMNFPLPFARELGRGDVMGGAAPYVAAVGAFSMILCPAEYYASRSTIGTAIYAVFVFLVMLSAQWMTRAPHAGPPARLEAAHE